MAIVVPAEFTAAQESDANIIASQVQLVLGNYFSAPGYGTTISSSNDDVSGHYPAAGAIDGDRTELNVGAASSADDNVGLSSWRSGAAATPSAAAYLIITMTQARTINRVKLYHLTGHALKTFGLSYWANGMWNLFAATADFSAAQTVIATTGTLDTIDFPDVITTQILLTITGTVVSNDPANVVEIEAYRKVDVTSRVKGISVKRSRDYKLANPLAATASIQLNNDDRFFSISHVPTAAELAAGFINQELRPGTGLIISLGFNPFSGIYTTPLFVGNVDRITVSPASRDAMIEARDFTKILINTIEYSPLKSNIDISDCVLYLLNRANISTFETNLDESGILLPTFFVDDNDDLSTIQDLVQAAVDALFYFDELGIAQLKCYAQQFGQSNTWNTEVEWNAGTLTNVDLTTNANAMTFDLGGLFGGSFQQHPVAANFTFSSGLTTGGSPGNFFVQIGAGSTYGYNANTNVVGRWTIGLDLSGAAGTGQVDFYIMAATANPFHSGYKVTILPTGGIQIYKVDSSGTATAIGSGGTLSGTLTISRYSNGQIYVANSAGITCEALDTTYNTSSFSGIVGTLGGTGARMLPYGIATGDFTGTWISPALNTGANTMAFGTLTLIELTNGGSLIWQTASSPDNVTYSAFVNLGVGGAIMSPAAQYLKIKLIADPLNAAPPIGNGDSGAMVVYSATATWSSSQPSQKYPSTSSFTFSFDGSLLAAQQEYADNLSGDSAILNDVTVQAEPLILNGTNADVQWTFVFNGLPLGSSNPLNFAPGQSITFTPYIAGGIDTSWQAIPTFNDSGHAGIFMSYIFGNDGDMTLTWNAIHPTKPVFTLTASAAVQLSSLTLNSQAYGGANSVQIQQAFDEQSINLFGDRQEQISNQWIAQNQIALDIAEAIVANFKDLVSYVPTCTVRPTWSIQIGDRVTVEDDNLDIDDDFLVVGVEHTLSVSDSAADAKTALTLLAIPAGD